MVESFKPFKVHCVFFTFHVYYTSGVLTIFPSDHIRAPYTLINCWVSIWSALFNTTLEKTTQENNGDVDWFVLKQTLHKNPIMLMYMYKENNYLMSPLSTIGYVCKSRNPTVPDLVFMVLQGLYHLWELIRDIQFVGVKE